MKKFIIAIISFSALLVLWQGIYDWSHDRTGYKLFPDEYGSHVWLIDLITKEGVVDEHIVDYKIRGKTVYVLRMVATTVDCEIESLWREGMTDIGMITYRSDKREYYILDGVTRKKTGPLVYDEFKRITKNRVKLKVPKNYHASKGTYKEFISHCISVS